MRLRNLLVLPALGVMALAGCAPTTFHDGVPWITNRYKVTDARTQRVDAYPCIRFDSALVDDLDRAAARPDLEDARVGVLDVLDRAHALSLHSVRNELDRLPDDGWRELNRRYFGDDTVPDAAAREAIWLAFTSRIEPRYAGLCRRILNAGSRGEFDDLVEQLRDDIERSVKDRGRVARALPWALFTVPSALTMASINSNEYRGPMDRTFEQAVRYVPGPASGAAPPIDDEDWRLLQRFAPVLVQEAPHVLRYAPDTNEIGTVVAVNPSRIEIDTTEASVYAYARRISLGAHRSDLLQLVYTFWYPRHPSLKAGIDPEAGHIEGLAVRISLDDARRPLLCETFYACGCHHRVYPTASLEAAALAEHGGVETGKQYALEHDVRGHIDLVIPKILDDPIASEHPVVRCAEGHHAILDVDFAENGHAREVVRSVEYRLRPYDDLERLPLADGSFTSMFYDNGLVKGARRLEGVFFTPIGILSAGQPRQRGTQLIHWDQYDLDDPRLFERGLRLPESFTTRCTNRSSGSPSFIAAQ